MIEITAGEFDSRRINAQASTSVARSTSYEAGSMGRRLSAWRASGLGPNTAILRGDIETLRARSRDAVRNNSWIKKGVSSWVSNEVGTGIEPRSMAPDDNFRKAAKNLWDQWIEFADADGVLNFYGMLALCSRSRIEGGEIFIRKRLRPDTGIAVAGLPVPLQYQLLEPEYCPTWYNAVGTNGRFIRAGIEFDPIGQRRAYWLYRQHPA